MVICFIVSFVLDLKFQMELVDWLRLVCILVFRMLRDSIFNFFNFYSRRQDFVFYFFWDFLLCSKGVQKLVLGLFGLNDLFKLLLVGLYFMFFYFWFFRFFYYFVFFYINVFSFLMNIGFFLYITFCDGIFLVFLF